MRWVLVALLTVSMPSFGFVAPRVAIEIKVLDSKGAPIEGATVEGAYHGASSGSGSLEKEFTNKDGIAAVVGRSVFPVDLYVSKTGYYNSGMTITAREVVDGREIYRDRNVTITLREKRNPIPLYAMKYSGEIPVARGWIGFDLEKADWVAPYGKGITPDLIFRYEGYAKDFFHAQGELQMKFSSPHDGMADITNAVTAFSQLKVPHEAPVSGFSVKEKRWKFRFGEGAQDAEYTADESKHYFMRVRSVVGPDGKLLQSNYAKVYHDVIFDPRMKKNEKGAAWIRFTYYFNPIPNDRNLEFDVTHNLFERLVQDKQVWEP